jgi:hypothetical protein
MQDAGFRARRADVWGPVPCNPQTLRGTCSTQTGGGPCSTGHRAEVGKGDQRFGTGVRKGTPRAGSAVLTGSNRTFERLGAHRGEEQQRVAEQLHRLGRAQRRELALQALRRAVLRKPRDLRWKGRDVSS